MIKRLITAIIFVLAILGSIFGGPYSFVLVFGLIAGLCLWEFLWIVLPKAQERYNTVRRIIGVIYGLLPFAIVSIIQLEVMNKPLDLILYSTLLAMPVFFLLFIIELFLKSSRPFQNIAFILLAMAYIGAPFSFLNLIAFEAGHFYINVIFGLIILTWTNDTAAYVVGSQMGKTPFFPRISPKKTWEGSIGAVILTLLMGIGLSFVFNDLQFRDWLVLSVIVSVFGTCGDLVESMLKRSFVVKDSGGLLPGHGGFLDRFDAFIFIIPFAAMYLLWIR